MTPHQRTLLDAIRRLSAGGIAPTYDQLRLECGLSSKSEVHRMVDALCQAGYLARLPAKARSLVLTTPQPLDAMNRDALLALRSEIDRRLAA